MTPSMRFSDSVTDLALRMWLTPVTAHRTWANCSVSAAPAASA